MWCRWHSMRAMRMYASRPALFTVRRSLRFRVITAWSCFFPPSTPGHHHRGRAAVWNYYYDLRRDGLESDRLDFDGFCWQRFLIKGISKFLITRLSTGSPIYLRCYVGPQSRHNRKISFRSRELILQTQPKTAITYDIIFWVNRYI